MSNESREDVGMKDADICGALGVGMSMVERVRRRCMEKDKRTDVVRVGR